ncbi:hypothetical protein JMJ77_0013222 [Colletotrichum scovillei]|uniref:Uncharacterized protein n=1 Tax=Colletotrichum scovillei TaxID=1209932 RepID=A0A9P7R6J4_9PEZI|nr:hypothetical protein JMJ77_0013222 [Colletotrichum scovillei]KAG7069516.1 hypothetical protein JMJ76_0003184 [Colletotrichum scovillei]KAG7073463.1 hypothetical protein JMJ78_0014437 [Colletotrichum scovillei]
MWCRTVRGGASRRRRASACSVSNDALHGRIHTTRSRVTVKSCQRLLSCLPCTDTRDWGPGGGSGILLLDFSFGFFLVRRGYCLPNFESNPGPTTTTDW